MRPLRRFLLPLLLLPLLLQGCGAGESTEVLLSCASPDGRQVATLYRVSFGERQIDQELRLNLRPADLELDTGMHSFAIRHGYDAVLHWHGNEMLEVDYPADSEIRAQEMVVFGSSQTFSSSERISVRYRELPSTHGYFMVEQRCFNDS